MKSINLLILFVIVLLISCKKNDQYCDEAMDEMSSQTFTGTIYLCNAQPPEMDFLEATASINSINSNLMSIHLVSDTSLIDTILTYIIDCEVVESDIPIVFIKDNLGSEQGQYNQSPDRISFAFSYPNCLNNSHFEGIAN
jgi:hypothetical protein